MKEAEKICRHYLNISLETAKRSKELLQELIAALKIEGYDIDRISKELEIKKSIILYGIDKKMQPKEKVTKPLSLEMQRKMFNYLKIEHLNK